MKFLGFALVIAGGWFIDCAVVNRAPVGGILTIIQNPSNLQSTLAKTKGTGPGGSNGTLSPALTSTGSATPTTANSTGTDIVGGQVVETG